jgi:streptogrisin C
MRSRRVLAAVAVLAVAAGVAAITATGGSGAAEVRPAEAPPADQVGGVSSPTTTSYAVGEAPKREAKAAIDVEGPLEGLERAGREAFGADYAGTWRADDGSVHVAVAGGAASAAPTSLRADVSDPTAETATEATVEVVEHPLAEIESFRARFDEAGEAIITDGGVRLASWWVDPAANAVRVEVIGTEADLPAAAEIIARYVGEGPLQLEAVTGGAVPTSRTNDSDPHNGGTKIYNPFGTCTSGLYWFKAPSTLQMATAGHCVLAYSFWITTADWYGVTGGSWNGMDDSGSDHVDAAMITLLSTGQPYFYVGGPSSSSLVYVSHSYAGSHSGLTGLRTSGAITGETQSGTGTVRSVNSTVAFYDGNGNYTDTRYGLNRADCWVQAGDSGGPVYRILTGGYIAAMGVIVAGLEDIGDQCYYTPVATIIAKYGGAVAG